MCVPTPRREEIMRDARYYVVRDHDGWMIKFEDEHYGPYSSHDDAVRFALDAARKLGDQGECAHVCMAGDDGRFQPRWSYGRGQPALMGA
jgi:Uncharacterized protein conserved in bacteria (DUF2188)